MLPQVKKIEETAPKSPYNGSDAVIASLKNQGVTCIFGMIGGGIMPVYDALYRDGTLNHIIVGHEQGAAHMAEGFARSTGRPGVVMTTSGPGATNLVTGLADAMMDSTPLVAITGQVPSTLLGNDAFQEADMWGISMPVTKHNYQVRSVEELPDIFAEAFYVAMSGRPGPVLIDLPKDVSVAPAAELVAEPTAPQGYQSPYQGDPVEIAKALDLIQRAERPVILAGGGVVQAGASSELIELAEMLDFSVTTTLMGMGAFPAAHKLSLGMPGMHGTGYANLALAEADLVLCVGCRLDDRVTGKVEAFCPKATLIHIDVDASEIGKILPCSVPLVGDAKPILRELVRGAKAQTSRADTGQWLKQLDEWKAAYPMVYPERPGILAPQRVIEEMGARLADDTIIVTGVGQHQMFTAQYYPFKGPRTFISSGGLGTMGFGLPAAIGAKVGNPEKDVVCIDGDGSFLMNIQELATAVRYGIGIVSVVQRNFTLGMVRQWQDMFFDKRISQSQLEPPPYAKVAESFGGLGKEVKKPAEFAPALDWAVKEAREKSLPVVLDVLVEAESKVLPMVPAGEANTNFLPCEKKE